MLYNFRAYIMASSSQHLGVGKSMLIIFLLYRMGLGLLLVIPFSYIGKQAAVPETILKELLGQFGGLALALASLFVVVKYLKKHLDARIEDLTRDRDYWRDRALNRRDQ